MRWVVFGLLMLGVIEPAVAADYVDDSYLRGSQPYEPGRPTYYRWSGFYGGVQGGSAIGSANFGNGVSGLIAYILRNSTLENESQPSTWTTLNKNDVVGTSWGGFIGYNGQWENAVLGVELNYNRTSLDLNSTDTLGRSVGPLSDGYVYTVNLTGSARDHVTDSGTLRARAGWVYDNFMPYGFAGLAVGRADVTRSASVDVVGNTAAPPPAIPRVTLNQTAGADSPGAFAYGWALGAGVDIALLQNVFVRAEYEWVVFNNFKDTNVHIGTFRGAVGLKF
jgi:outer membrane immunogenic protein